MTHIPHDLDIRLIAAVGKEGQLGLEGKLPWHDPKDLEWFRENTTGGVVIVGHNTYEHLREVLPIKHATDHFFGTTANRTIMRDNKLFAPEQIIAEEDLIDIPVWIGGGAKTYKRWMHLVRRFVISKAVEHGEWYNGPADTFLPPILPNWGYSGGTVRRNPLLD